MASNESLGYGDRGPALRNGWNDDYSQNLEDTAMRHAKVYTCRNYLI